MVRYHQAEQNNTLSIMKRIIALYGHAECGKSRTMNILRELIRENGITACRTRGESINEVYEQEKNLNIKAEWFRKSYEYHLCQDTLERCNQEFARVMFDALSK